jgi:nitrite reductase (NADH) small subunit
MTRETGNWVRITPVENIPLREGRSVTVGGREIAIFNLGDRFTAMENRCPHRGGPLAEGMVSSTGGMVTVTCPLHNWRLAMDNGCVVKPSGQDAACVRTYPAREENGIVTICVTSEAAGVKEEEPTTAAA